MPDKVIDLIDENFNKLKPVSKHEAHAVGRLHRTVIAEVRDFTENIILVRQAPDRQNAKQYVLPVGGHLKAGESIIRAPYREAPEEVGANAFTPTYNAQLQYERQVIGRHENHLFIIFQAVVDPSHIRLGEESTDFRSFSFEESKFELGTNPAIYGASCGAVFNHCYPASRIKSGGAALN